MNKESELTTTVNNSEIKENIQKDSSLANYEEINLVSSKQENNNNNNNNNEKQEEKFIAINNNNNNNSGNNNNSDNSWSFTNLWGSATKVINETQQSDYFQKNFNSVKTKLTELTETVKTNPNVHYLGNTMDKLGSELVDFTRESVGSVLETLKPNQENILGLEAYLFSINDYISLERDINQIWDHMEPEHKQFQKLELKDGTDTLKSGPNALPEETLKLLDLIAPGFEEAFNVIKFKLETAFNTHLNQPKESIPPPKTGLLSTLESTLLIPVKNITIYIGIQPFKAQLIQGQEDYGYCIGLFAPNLKEFNNNEESIFIHTFTQMLPKHLAKKYFSDSMGKKNILNDEEKMIIDHIIQFGIKHLLLEFFNQIEFKEVNDEQVISI